MYRVKDLTHTINNRPNSSYLNTALTINWNWQSYERDEAAAKNNMQRKLTKEAKAKRYGLRLRYLGD